MKRDDIVSLKPWEPTQQEIEAVQEELDYIFFCLAVKEGYSAAATDRYFGGRSDRLYAKWLRENGRSV